MLVVAFMGTFYGFLMFEARVDYLERHAVYLEQRLDRYESRLDSSGVEIARPYGNEE